MNTGGFGDRGYNHTSRDSGSGGGSPGGNNHYSYVTQMVTFINSDLRRIPIASSNNLPHCSLLLGQSMSALFSLCCLT